MNNGFPNFPKKGDKVKFTMGWQFDSYNIGYQHINSGEIGEVLDTHVIDGHNFDVADGYLIYIGVTINNKIHIIKFPYSDRPEVLEILPDTPASRVLFGRR